MDDSEIELGEPNQNQGFEVITNYNDLIIFLIRVRVRARTQVKLFDVFEKR